MIKMKRKMFVSFIVSSTLPPSFSWPNCFYFLLFVSGTSDMTPLCCWPLAQPLPHSEMLRCDVPDNFYGLQVSLFMALQFDKSTWRSKNPNQASKKPWQDCEHLFILLSSTSTNLYLHEESVCEWSRIDVAVLYKMFPTLYLLSEGQAASTELKFEESEEDKVYFDMKNGRRKLSVTVNICFLISRV